MVSHAAVETHATHILSKTGGSVKIGSGLQSGNTLAHNSEFNFCGTRHILDEETF